MEVENRVKELQRNKVDTIVYYECCSRSDVFSSKPSFDPGCLVWLKSGKMFMQKFATRRKDFKQLMSNSIQLESNQLKYLLQNKLETIIAETVYQRVVRFSNDTLELYMPLSHPHDNIAFIMFFLNRDTYSKQLNLDDLYTEIYRDSMKNLNYKYNQGLILKSLKEMLESQLSTNENRFVMK